MKNKILIGLFAILTIGIVAQYFIYKNEVSFLEQENLDLLEEKKTDLKKVRDSAFVKINEITVNSKNRFDSIANIPPIIKWYPYEKPIFINRDVDSALDIISRYNYNSEKSN
jgi:hypothetical protein